MFSIEKDGQFHFCSESVSFLLSLPTIFPFYLPGYKHAEEPSHSDPKSGTFKTVSASSCRGSCTTQTPSSSMSSSSSSSLSGDRSVVVPVPGRNGSSSHHHINKMYNRRHSTPVGSRNYLTRNATGILLSAIFDLSASSVIETLPSSESTAVARLPAETVTNNSQSFEQQYSSVKSVSKLFYNDIIHELLANSTVDSAVTISTGLPLFDSLLSTSSSSSHSLAPERAGEQTAIQLETIVETAQYNNDTEIFTTIVLEPDLRIHHPTLAILLGLLCVVVVFGNVLTMVSIYRERYLHTVTNYFIASLAAADCLVGAVVMPFSVVHEVMNKWWIFGRDWCDLWHSFDVLASSASILNLCAISLDRYWAITDPITYPSRMTPTRASLIIFGIWACSALISFPAIVWWRAVLKEPPEAFRCNFTDDPGYLVFSSSISFYGPLTVMVFTYYRIYVIANQQTKSLKLGVKQIEIGCENTSKEYPNAPSGGFALRMHRGGYNRASTESELPHKCYINNNNNNNHNHSNTENNTVANDNDNIDETVPISSIEKSFVIIQSQQQHESVALRHAHSRHRTCSSTFSDPTTVASNTNRSFINQSKSSSTSVPSSTNSVGANSKVNLSVGRRLAKLAKERKAAKTLGIVMGVFILCWMPFFITNVLIGICPSCLSEVAALVFSIVTWLGWFNSALNPIIYACWSRDFRRAFRKILCFCVRKRRANLSYDRNRNYKPPSTNQLHSVLNKNPFTMSQEKKNKNGSNSTVSNSITNGSDNVHESNNGNIKSITTVGNPQATVNSRFGHYFKPHKKDRIVENCFSVQDYNSVSGNREDTEERNRFINSSPSMPNVKILPIDISNENGRH